MKLKVFFRFSLSLVLFHTQVACGISRAFSIFEISTVKISKGDALNLYSFSKEWTSRMGNKQAKIEKINAELEESEEEYFAGAQEENSSFAKTKAKGLIQRLFFEKGGVRG